MSLSDDQIAKAEQIAKDEAIRLSALGVVDSVHCWQTAALVMQDERDAALASLARLRTALEFYAGLGMVELHSGDREPGEFIQDLGATARAALASTRPDASQQE